MSSDHWYQMMYKSAKKNKRKKFDHKIGRSETKQIIEFSLLRRLHNE